MQLAEGALRFVGIGGDHVVQLSAGEVHHRVGTQQDHLRGCRGCRGRFKEVKVHGGVLVSS